ncbi:MAG: hypothetical protein JO002_15905 [Burkholderiaceae bacterium]|nr:hypothetical protein [Burkholderiaceae bacterium]
MEPTVSKCSIPTALKEVAAGRASILTEEFAHLIGLKNQTVRRYLYQKGSVFGVRPFRIGRKLQWPVEQVAALLNGEAE